MLTAAKTKDQSLQNRRARLREIIQVKSVIKDREMRLVSGRKTDIYFNLKATMLDQEGGTLLSQELLDMLCHEQFDSVGGLAIGAVPLVQSIVISSYGKIPLRAFFVRSDIKEHGTMERIEANFRDGDRVIILDDVTTTGGSVLKAIEAVRSRRASVLMVITIVDRQEGAKENLQEHGVELVSLFTKDEF